MRPPVPGDEQQRSAGGGARGEQDRGQGEGLLAKPEVGIAEPFDGDDCEGLWLLDTEYGRWFVGAECVCEHDDERGHECGGDTG